MSRQLISVLMITYNHEQFISQAISSILAQKGDFDMELVIGNDCSTDRSDEICQAFAQKDSRIKYYYHKKNIGANQNFKYCFDKCLGTYIALCEGDDYWTDENKLQKQYDFLSRNPNFKGCFHNVSIVSEGGSTISNELLNSSVSKFSYTRADICKNNIVPTLSLLFKKIDLPHWLPQVKIGDLVIHMKACQYGNYFYMNSIMGAYRLHEKSNYESQNRENKLLQKIEVFSHLLNDKTFKFTLKERYLLHKNLYSCYHEVYSKKYYIKIQLRHFIRKIISKRSLLN